jgi:hypothetical protein
MPFTASVLYVAAASLRAAEGRGVRPWVVALFATGLAIRAAWRERREDALAEWGLAIVLASMGAQEGGAWLGAFGSVGAGAACIGAQLAVARIQPMAGEQIVVSRTTSPLVGLVALAAAWALAVASYVHAAMESSHVGLAPTIYAGLAAAILFLSCLNATRERLLELGIVDRLRASAAAIAVILALAAWAALAGLGTTERIVRLAISFAALVTVRLSLHGDAVAIARSSRHALVLAATGGALIMLGAMTAMGRPDGAGVITIVTALVALFVGLMGPSLASPFRPARGAWLDAIEKAQTALLRSDPEEALAQVLVALREPAGAAAASPEIWTFGPEVVMRIDAAGYAREREGLCPEGILEVAGREPEATLRTEVLDAVEVRRPDLRSIFRWMEERGALSATVVTRSGEAEALLVIPRGTRSEHLSLEEARAIKRLADQLASICHSRGALARSFERERAAMVLTEQAEERAARLQHSAEVDAERHVRATTRLARPATVGVYSAVSRFAYDALERRTRAAVPVVVVAASGVDPIPYLARAHLSGARSSAPLVLVDGTAAREHDVKRWIDPASSPLAHADHGMLVLVDGAALPLDVQLLIGRALAEKRAPWERAEPLDVLLALTTVTNPDELVVSGRLDPLLASRLGDAIEAPICLPRIRERSEDVRAILTDRLAREGLRVRGTPIGLDDGAYAKMVEYTFPGEDAELSTIVQALVAGCTGDVIHAADVDRLGLEVEPESPAKFKPGVRLA